MLTWQNKRWGCRETNYNQKRFVGCCSGIWDFSMVDHKLYTAAGDGVNGMLAINESLLA
jgi:hypothetical protein